MNPSKKTTLTQTGLSQATSWDIIQLRRNQLGQFALLSLDSYISSCMLMPLRGKLWQCWMTNVKLWEPWRLDVDDDLFNNHTTITGQQASTQKIHSHGDNDNTRPIRRRVTECWGKQGEMPTAKCQCVTEIAEEARGSLALNYVMKYILIMWYDLMIQL